MGQSGFSDYIYAEGATIQSVEEGSKSEEPEEMLNQDVGRAEKVCGTSDYAL